MQATSFGTIEEGIKLVEALHEILFAHAYRLRTRSLFFGTPPKDWLFLESEYKEVGAQNAGLAGYLYRELIHDEAFANATFDFLEKLSRADATFVEQLEQSRAARGLPKVDPYSKDPGQPIDYSIGDVDADTRGFDVLGEMIESAVSQLGADQKTDPQRVSEVVHKILLYFHDDVDHFSGENRLEENEYLRESLPPGSLERANQASRPPKRLSLVYTDWAYLEPAENLVALKYLEQEMNSRLGKYNYRLASLRMANYHYFAAAGLYRLGFVPHFKYVPFRAAIFSQIQRLMAAQYRKQANSRYREKIHEKIREDLRKTDPKMALKLDSLFATLRDVMGELGADGRYTGGYFNHYLNSEEALKELAQRLDLLSEGQLTSETKATLIRALLEEQLLAVQQVRTLQQHQRGRELSEWVELRIRYH